MALALDTNAGSHAIGAVNTAQSKAVSITTNLTNDLICVFAHAYNAGTGVGAVTFSVSDTAGLTWTRRGTLRVAGGFGQLIELWTAVASGTLSGDTITATISGGVNFNQISISAIAINGADISSSFDANGALPATAGTTSGGAVTASVSTSNANDILLYFEGTSTTLATPSGFTALDSNTATSLSVRDGYKIVAATQSGLSVAGSGGTADAIFVDAIKQASSGVIVIPPDLFETRAL